MVESIGPIDLTEIEISIEEVIQFFENFSTEFDVYLVPDAANELEINPNDFEDAPDNYDFIKSKRKLKMKEFA